MIFGPLLISDIFQRLGLLDGGSTCVIGMGEQWAWACDYQSWLHVKIIWGELKNANAQDQMNHNLLQWCLGSIFKNPSGHFHVYLGLKQPTLREAARPGPEINHFPGNISGRSNTRL